MLDPRMRQPCPPWQKRPRMAISRSGLQRAEGDSDGARPDGDVRRLDAYDINEQRAGQNRSSAADQSENEANKRARRDG